MNPLDDLLPTAEPLDLGGPILVELAAAVSYLRRGARPGITVWDAIEEALRWHAGFDADWNDPDPLQHALRLCLLSAASPSAAELLQIAIRRWLTATSGVFNAATPFA